MDSGQIEFNILYLDWVWKLLTCQMLCCQKSYFTFDLFAPWKNRTICSVRVLPQVLESCKVNFSVGSDHQGNSQFPGSK